MFPCLVPSPTVVFSRVFLIVAIMGLHDGLYYGRYIHACSVAFQYRYTFFGGNTTARDLMPADRRWVETIGGYLFPYIDLTDIYLHHGR